MPPYNNLTAYTAYIHSRTCEASPEANYQVDLPYYYMYLDRQAGHTGLLVLML
jgi:hypothetical protein